MLAILELSDYFWMAILLLLFTGGTTYARFRPRDQARLRRIEEKVDLLLVKFQLSVSEEGGDFKTEIRRLVEEGRKIEAIKIYREKTGVGLAEAKSAVEAIAEGSAS